MRGLVGFLAALGAVPFALLAYFYLTLPDVRGLRDANPATTAFMELRAGEARARGEESERRWEWVAYDRISPQLRRAVLVTEDAAFWDHDGLDYDEIRKAIEESLEARVIRRGASTITQQLARNLYLSPSRDPIRKLREILITRRLETELSKQRIFELYLNVVEWGEGIWGAEAAARAYFGKSAAQLTPAESALLAGALINPRVHSPARPTPRLRARQRIILARMGASEPPPAAAAGAPPAGGATPGEDERAPDIDQPDGDITGGISDTEAAGGQDDETGPVWPLGGIDEQLLVPPQ